MEFDLIQVLSACVHLGAFAGQVIREVVDSGDSLHTVNKADASSFDPQTIADTRAQQRIVDSLRRSFGPALVIVGEEGQLDPPAEYDTTTAVRNLLSHDANIIMAQDIVVWIDPLDGTRKFTEKLYDDVSVLLGISYKGRPIAGVMHQPFHGQHGTTYYGGPAVNGVFKSQLGSYDPASWHFESVSPIKISRAKSIVGISESRCGIADKILPSLGMEIIAKGSTGILLLDVALGLHDAYYRWIGRTKRWDTCVGEAFLIAFGGLVTDREGRLYDYNANICHENINGVVASLNKASLEFIVTTTQSVIKNQ